MHDEQLQAALQGIGFSSDYAPPFNVRENALDLLEWIEFENTDEDHKNLIWLCNQIARIGQREPGTLEFRDNFRACRLADAGAGPSSRYLEAQSRGCCGFEDVRLVNPKTGAAFMVGFNYGH